MEFRILGPLEVLENGSPLPIAGAKQRALLAVLLLEANRVVSADRLIDELWGEATPDDGRNALQVRVSQLRKTVPTAALLTRAPGYVMEVAPSKLDSACFERLLADARVAQAAGEMETAGRLFRQGLALWRGRPLEDVSLLGPAAAEVRQLDELHLTAQEERIDCDLALGRHRDLVPELQTLVAQHPLRERLRGQLMLALYRSGRQAEALAAYRDARRALVEDLGIEPGPELQQLEHDVLTQSPSLQPRGQAPQAEDTSTALRSRLLRRRVTGAVVAIALLAAVVGLTLVLWPRGTSSRNAHLETVIAVPRSFVGMVRVDPHDDRVVDRVRLPGDLAEGSGTFADGSMWIAGSTGVDRVDPQSGVVLAKIPITGGAAGIAGSDTNGIWLTSHAPDENAVWQIDPSTNAVARRVALPGHPYAGPWIGDKVVWLASTSTIWKLDPTSGKILGRIPYNIPTRATDNIASAGYGALWLADPEGLVPGGGLRFGVVVRVDEQTDKLSRVPVPRVDGVAVGGGAVWARSGIAGELTGTGDVTEINPDTNHVIQTIKLGHADWVVAGRDAVWVENATDKTVVRINPATGERVARLRLPPTEKAIGEAGGLFWVSVWPD